VLFDLETLEAKEGRRRRRRRRTFPLPHLLLLC
jgi:hypothetical protein